MIELKGNFQFPSPTTFSIGKLYRKIMDRILSDLEHENDSSVGISATHAPGKCEKCEKNQDKKYHPDYTKCPYNPNLNKSESC